MDALDKLRKHEDITSEERALLDFQICAGRHTRQQLATLLTAILCERVEGFNGNPTNYLEAGRALLDTLLKSAVDDKLLEGHEASRGRRKADQTFRPAALLTLWGETRKAIEARRSDRALKSFLHRQSLAA